jgi:hypothetical protein
MIFVILYHGGYCEISKPEIITEKNHKDFGTGFYCTSLKEQAERWSKRYSSPIVNTYEYTADESLKTLLFPEMNDEWLDFIADCRSGKPHDFDIVEGAMANDQVWNYVADFLSGILTKEQFWILAKFKHPTHQIAFCSNKAIDRLSFSNSYEVKK